MDTILRLSWTNRVTARCEVTHSRGWWGQNWSRAQSYSSPQSRPRWFNTHPET